MEEKAIDTQSRINSLIGKQAKHVATTLNMIAPSNVTPQCVLDCMGSPFNAVVSEGYRDEGRYHAGSEVFDELEELGDTITKEVFGVKYINFKPHSGTQAIQGTLLALKSEGRNHILSMGVKEGGNVAHRNITSFNKAVGFQFSKYGVTEDFEIDYDHVRDIAKQKKPEIVIAGASSFPGVIDWKQFKEIADEVGARFVADMSQYAGLIAGDAYPSPVQYADLVIMTTSKTIPGPKGGIIMTTLDDPNLQKKVNETINIGLQQDDIPTAIAGKIQAISLAQRPEFKEYAKRTVRVAKKVAQTLHESNVPVVGYNEKTKGTDSHIVLIDVHAYNQSLDGSIVANWLEQAGIHSNMNQLPNDNLGPRRTRGIRFGTNGMSILGMDEKEANEVAGFIKIILDSNGNQNTISHARSMVAQLREQFPKTVFD